uniref:BHLH domain-containing protein n=1 Tax=Physcomitrium patens TaxID=3218 RepID=A0A7I4CRA2_PHYPA
MTDLISILESSGSSREEMCPVAVPSSVASSCERLIWEGWTAQPSPVEESTTSKLLPKLLPELETSSYSALTLQQPDALSSILSVLHPFSHYSSASLELARNPDWSLKSSNPLRESSSEAGIRTSSFEGLYSGQHTTKKIHLGVIPYHLSEDQRQCAVSPPENECRLLSANSSGSLHWWHSIGPESPSSTLAFHNIGIQHSTFEKCEPRGQSHSSWPAASGTSPTVQYFHAHSADNEGVEVVKQDDSQISKALATYQPHGDHSLVLNSDRIASTTSHSEDPCGPKPGRRPAASYDTEMILSPSESFLTTPNMLSTLECVISGASNISDQYMNFVREPQEQRLSSISDLSLIPDSHADPHSIGFISGTFRTDSHGTGIRKNRIFLSDEESDFLPKKRSKYTVRGDFQMDRFDAVWGNTGLRGSSCPGNSVSQMMAIYEFGPALNRNGRPRVQRGSATDPQSVHARARREKIAERLRKLQHLIPNGGKVNLCRMTTNLCLFLFEIHSKSPSILSTSPDSNASPSSATAF